MSDDFFKVIVSGKRGVGISTLLRNYTGLEHSNDLFLTLGVDFYVKDFFCDEKPYKMQLWRISKLYSEFIRIEQYFGGAKGLILLYDLTDLKSLLIIPRWVKFITGIEPNIPIMILGNKIDLPDHRQVFNDDIAYFVDRYKISLAQEISADKRINVDNAFNKFFTKMIREAQESKQEQVMKVMPKMKTYDNDSYDYNFKVIVFGKPSQNRTRLMRPFRKILTCANNSKMTIGFDLDQKCGQVDGMSYKLQIWDFVGSFKFIIPIYIRGVRGGFFVFDVNDFSSLNCIDQWLSQIKNGLRKQISFPIIVVGLITGSIKNRQVSSEEAIEISKARGVNGYIECNPETGENVEKMFESLISLMIQYQNVLTL